MDVRAPSVQLTALLAVVLLAGCDADEFTPGLDGGRHIDLYVGEETGPGFTDSDLYLTLTGAALRIG